MKQQNEIEESQEFSTDLKRVGSIHTNNSSEDIRFREDFVIADLKMKLKILKDGILEERKKNLDLDKETQRLRLLINNQENLLNEKENQIVSLTKEKYSLICKMSAEKQKLENNPQHGKFSNLISGLFNKKEESKIDDNDLAKLQNENNDLKIENSELKNKIEEQFRSFENTKTEYQNFIAIQIEEIKKLKNQIDEKNRKIEEPTKQLEILRGTLRQMDVEKVNLETKIFDLENSLVSSKKSSQNLILELQQEIDVLREEINNILKHTSNSYRKINSAKFYESDIYQYLYANIQNFRGNVKSCVLVKNNLDVDLIYSNFSGSISGWFIEEKQFYERAFGHDGIIKPGWCGGFNHIKKRDTVCGSVGYFGFNLTYMGEDYHAICGFSNAYSGINSVGVMIDKGYYTLDSNIISKELDQLVTMEYYKGNKGPCCTHVKVFEANGISVKVEFFGYGTEEGSGNNSFYFEFNSFQKG